MQAVRSAGKRGEPGGSVAELSGLARETPTGQRAAVLPSPATPMVLVILSTPDAQGQARRRAVRSTWLRDSTTAVV